MTTPNTDLTEQIAQAIYGNPPPWCEEPYGLDESRHLAAATLPIVDAAVKRARVEAWQDGHTTGFEDALLACEIAAGIKPGPPPGPTSNPYREDPTRS